MREPNSSTYISSNWKYFPSDFWAGFLTNKLYPSINKEDIPEDFTYGIIVQF